MILQSKRLLELAGLPEEETSNILNESSIIAEYEEAVEPVETDKVGECDESDKISEEADAIKESLKLRRVVKSELERMWASGEVFGKKAANKDGVTMGFLGVGFKR